MSQAARKDTDVELFVELDRRVRALEGSNPSPLRKPWHYVGDPGEPPFMDGWDNAFGGNNPAGFFKDPFGMVHLRGSVITTQVGVQGIFFLPENCWPGRAGVTIELPMSIGIEPNGRVICYDGAQNAGVYRPLDGLSFYAENST